MSFTVVPLHFVELAIGTRIPFGPDFVLRDIPEWLRRDKGIMNDIELADRARQGDSRKERENKR